MPFIKYGVYKDSLTSIEMIALCVCFALHDLVFKEPLPTKKVGSE